MRRALGLKGRRSSGVIACRALGVVAHRALGVKGRRSSGVIVRRAFDIVVHSGVKGRRTMGRAGDGRLPSESIVS